MTKQEIPSVAKGDDDDDEMFLKFVLMNICLHFFIYDQL